MAKKSKGKRMAMGGMGMSNSPSDGVTNYMPPNRSKVRPGVATPMQRSGRGGSTAGTSSATIQNMGPDNMGSGTSSSYPVTNYPGVERPMSPPALGGGAPSVLPPVNDKFLRPGTPKTPAVMPPPTMTKPMPRPGTPQPPAVMPEVSTPMPRGGMRGGGLAKKGVGMALKKGGLVKGAGCASRGVKKPRYT